MNDESGTGPGAPAWIVTFADMMALLLTFFIMLASFSELKSEEKYQALLDAFHQQFGFLKPGEPLQPGELRPRHSALARLADLGRSQRAGRRPAGSPNAAPAAENPPRETGGSGTPTGSGTVLYFSQEQLIPDEAQR